MLEVAEGVRYIHTEGIVHGDLKGDDVLLDANYHCQIADFGLTRHLDATFTQAASPSSLNFAAPELFGACDKCGGTSCDTCRTDHDAPKGNRKTKETDVYAFGCLYYAIFFDTLPFLGRSEYQIPRLVTSGSRPDRLKNPTIDDNIWDIIQSCWSAKPSDRWTMEKIVESLTSPSAQVQISKDHRGINGPQFAFERVSQGARHDTIFFD
ncbi:kinase-like domain-containing protein [Amanita rubescens]|nr:kinase-like domain-containing protein [Amanita rubescens]